MRLPDNAVKPPPVTNLDWAEWARRARECPGRPLSRRELALKEAYDAKRAR